jgi:Ca2+/Na+ antiporter
MLYFGMRYPLELGWVSSNNQWNKWAFVIAIAWCLVLIFFMLRKKDEKRAQDSDHQSKNPSKDKSNGQ